MPLVFDQDYNRWTRVVGSALLALLAVVLAYTASWLLLAILFVCFVAIGVVVRSGRRTPHPALDQSSITDVLVSQAPPLDLELRSLWAQGRAMLRATSSPPAPDRTPTEAALEPSPEPRPIAEVVEQWNARVAAIGDARPKSLTRLAFAGIIGFIALFGLSILTQPIKFAPLELVSVNGAEAQEGFVLLQGTRGMFVPSPFGQARFIAADQITSRELCDPAPQWWSVSLAEVVAPAPSNGVECRGR